MWLCNVMQEKQAPTKTHRCGWCMLLISDNFNTQRFNLHLLEIFFGGLASITSGKKQKQADSDLCRKKASVHMVLIKIKPLLLC